MLNHGVAELTVERRGGRSVVTRQFGKAPLQIHRPLYLERSDYPTVFLRTPSSGLLEGDRHTIVIRVQEQASLHLCTQAASLIYPGNSRSDIQIQLEQGASLTFYPHPLILARGARFTQSISIALEHGSRLCFRDVWCAGRIAMGERWMFEYFKNTVEVRLRSQLEYREHWTLRPAIDFPADKLSCDAYSVVETIYCLGLDDVSSCRSVNALLPGKADGRRAVRSWSMHKSSGVVTRLLHADCLTLCRA